MKFITTLTLMFLGVGMAAAQEIQDTIKAQELNEVVVEAANQRINAEVSTYIPMARQKNAAQNAVALLSQMSIPQIDVDPVSQAVKTAHGQNVSIFIDYVPATSEDLKGMKTQDVKKVEYYQHPSDVRFQGAKYAVNFVMQNMSGEDIPKSMPTSGLVSIGQKGNYIPKWHINECHLMYMPTNLSYQSAYGAKLGREFQVYRFP